MTTKPFEQTSFDASDALARKYIIDYMKTKHGLTFLNNSNRYGCDLISTTGDLLEVEQKSKAWIGNDFPHSTIHFLHRKLKYVNQGAHFAMCNADFSRVALINNKRLRQYCTPEYLIEVPNTAVNHDEYFFDIPTIAFFFDDLTNNYKQQQYDNTYEIWKQIKHENNIRNN